MFAFTLRQLEVFLAICETGSFRRASEKLDISEAAISNHIQMLEGHLGCFLFHRKRGTSATLSETGIEFQKDALYFRQEGIRLSHKFRQKPQQRVFKFYIGEHLMEDCIRPALPDFLLQNPDIQFSFISKYRREEIPENLNKLQADGILLIIKNEEHLPGSVLLSEVPSGIYGLAHLKSECDINGMSSISYLKPELRDIQSYNNSLNNLGVSSIKISGVYPYHDVGVRMALMGMGAILTFESIINAFDRDKKLVLIKRAHIWQRRLFMSPQIPENQAMRIRAFFEQALQFKHR